MIDKHGAFSTRGNNVDKGQKNNKLNDEELDEVTGGVFGLSEGGGCGYFGCNSPYAYALSVTASKAMAREKTIKRLIAEGDIAGAREKSQKMYNWLISNNYKKEAAAFKSAYWKYFPS